jgi:DNA-binding NarL/FixJ family response regulator
MRIVVADDEVLLREGLARLLTEMGFEVVGKAGDANELLRAVQQAGPDVAIVDIKMPPTHTDEGLVAAERISQLDPTVGVLVLSHYLESRYAMRLLERHPERVGYLLKERVSDVAVLTDAIRRVAEGECVIDPTIVSRLMARRRDTGPLNQLTEREREVLGLMAEGHSNQSICDKLFLSPKTVEAHISQIFSKFGSATRSATTAGSWPYSPSCAPPTVDLRRRPTRPSPCARGCLPGHGSPVGDR